MNDEKAQITELLHLAADGDPAAAHEVFSALYGELRRLASAQRARQRRGETLDTTALVHEVYLRLIGRLEISWEGRHHFFRTAARSMRDILVEDARRKATRKRGGDRVRLDLDDAEGSLASSPEDMIALDLALQKLEREYPDDFQVVMLRFFTGLTVDETADVLRSSPRSVARRWQFCRSWLARELDIPGQAGE